MVRPDALLPRPAFDPGSAEHARFVEVARDAGLDANDIWVGGYVGYEWDHLRLILASYALDVRGEKVLEFGCNVGASTVVLAALGAEVVAMDIDPAMVRLASANVDRHGFADDVAVVPSDPGAPMLCPDESFDFVLANSVLEYVDPGDLDEVIGEFHRTLRRGGTLLICGTASRLALREIHSRKWLVNYLPESLDRITGRELQRGLPPGRLAKALKGRFANAGPDRWLLARAAVHGAPSRAMRLLSRLSGLVGVPPGLMSSNIELLLRKVG